jgi:uncharacterized iron-regulated membrane protein
VFRALEDWHRWLGASAANRTSTRAVTGACNLAFLALAVSGLYLWWPRTWTPSHTRASARTATVRPVANGQVPGAA